MGRMTEFCAVLCFAEYLDRRLSFHVQTIIHMSSNTRYSFGRDLNGVYATDVADDDLFAYRFATITDLTFVRRLLTDRFRSFDDW
jgi:hypothetical protein